MGYTGELLTRKELISYLRTSSSALSRGIKTGKIPEGIRILGKPLWVKKTIDRIINGKTFSN
jgi:hypothetical protein